MIYILLLYSLCFSLVLLMCINNPMANYRVKKYIRTVFLNFGVYENIFKKKKLYQVCIDHIDLQRIANVPVILQNPLS